jgi:hypothetical protein
MTISNRHNKVVALPNDTDYDVSTNVWNEEHVLTMASNRLLGRTTAGAGAVEELEVSQLKLASGVLSAAPGSWVEVSRTVVGTAVATVDFTGIDSSADEWMVFLANVIPAVDNVSLMMRVSNDNGATFKSDDIYVKTLISLTMGGSITANTGAEFDAFYFGYAGIGNDANENGLSGSITFYRPSVSKYFECIHDCTGTTGTGARYQESGSGHYPAAQVTDAIRFLFQSSNIASGTFVLLKRIKS